MEEESKPEEKLAKQFHSIYERLASQFEYTTVRATAIPWDEIPDHSNNKRLMIATCKEILDTRSHSDLDELVKRIKEKLSLIQEGLTITHFQDRDELRWEMEGIKWVLSQIELIKSKEKT